MFAFLAFAIDLGYIMMAKSELQNAADSAALACAGTMGISQSTGVETAKTFATENTIGKRHVQLTDSDITYGTWNKTTNIYPAYKRTEQCGESDDPGR